MHTDRCARASDAPRFDHGARGLGEAVRLHAPIIAKALADSHAGHLCLHKCPAWQKSRTQAKFSLSYLPLSLSISPSIPASPSHPLFLFISPSVPFYLTPLSLSISPSVLVRPPLCPSLSSPLSLSISLSLPACLPLSPCPHTSLAPSLCSPSLHPPSQTLSCSLSRSLALSLSVSLSRARALSLKGLGFWV